METPYVINQPHWTYSHGQHTATHLRGRGRASITAIWSIAINYSLCTYGQVFTATAEQKKENRSIDNANLPCSMSVNSTTLFLAHVLESSSLSLLSRSKDGFLPKATQVAPKWKTQNKKYKKRRMLAARCIDAPHAVRDHIAIMYASHSSLSLILVAASCHRPAFSHHAPSWRPCAGCQNHQSSHTCLGKCPYPC